MIVTTEGINQLIRNNKDKIEVGKITDGFHTIDELYDHRCVLWIKMCKFYQWAEAEGMGSIWGRVWKTKKHSDGSEWEGWFLLGLTDMHGSDKARQLTYHIPIKFWDLCDFVDEIEIAPEFDGHTSEQVLERLKNL